MVIKSLNLNNMKKIFALSTLLSMIFTGCVSLENNHFTDAQPYINVLLAGFAENTRTFVENNKYLRWHEDDRLTAFYGNTLNRQYKFNGATGDNSGTFSLVPSGELGTGNAFDCIYALYPYSETATISDEGVISLTLPTVQSYAENSFGNGANTMIAVTENLEDTFLAFKNTCGYLKLKLYNADGATLKSIEVKGNNGEKIAGAATATIQFGGAPAVTMAEDASDTVTLDCGVGVALGTTAETATEFWIVLPETTFTKGITVIATDINRNVFEKTTNNPVVIERNIPQPMKALEVVCETIQPANNEIWYTATSKVTPYKTNVFGATISSNEWDSKTGNGTITFSGDVTTIGAYAFYSCSTMTSINIPNSVTSIGSSAFDFCTALKNITFGRGLATVEYDAFMSYNKIKVVNITDLSAWCKIDFEYSYTYSEAQFKHYSPLNGAELYLNGKKVTDLIIPLDITEIKQYAFYGCASLQSVIIHENVASIEKFAFVNCNKLMNIYCKPNTPPNVYYSWTTSSSISGAYSNKCFPNNSGMKIYVPTTSYDAYKQYSSWKNGCLPQNWCEYKSFIEPYDF